MPVAVANTGRSRVGSGARPSLVSLAVAGAARAGAPLAARCRITTASAPTRATHRSRQARGVALAGTHPAPAWPGALLAAMGHGRGRGHLVRAGRSAPAAHARRRACRRSAGSSRRCRCWSLLLALFGRRCAVTAMSGACVATLAAKPLILAHEALLEPTDVAYWLILAFALACRWSASSSCRGVCGRWCWLAIGSLLLAADPCRRRLLPILRRHAIGAGDARGASDRPRWGSVGSLASRLACSGCWSIGRSRSGSRSACRCSRPAAGARAGACWS